MINKKLLKKEAIRLGVKEAQVFPVAARSCCGIIELSGSAPYIIMWLLKATNHPVRGPKAAVYYSIDKNMTEFLERLGFRKTVQFKSADGRRVITQLFCLLTKTGEVKE